MHATLEAKSLSGVLPVHLRDNDIAEIDGDEAAVSDVEEVGAEGGISAAENENVILGLAVAVQHSAELAVLAVPLEGAAAALLEEAVPVFRLAELIVALGQEVHFGALWRRRICTV